MEHTFSSKQASAMTGLSVHTLRYYEQIGLIKGIRRDEHDYRQYSESALVWFQIIQYLRALGMPIRQMQQFLDLPNSGETAVRRKFLETCREKVVDQIKELEQALEKTDMKIGFFQTLEVMEAEEKGQS